MGAMTHPTPITEDFIRSIKQRHADRIATAEEERDQEIRDIVAAGWTQMDIVRLASVSREGVRQALDPEAKAAARKAAAERYAARKNGR